MDLSLSYDDVLLVPQYSSLKTRQECNYFEKIKGYKISPIIVSNMKITATPQMAKALAKQKILVPTHRFQPIEDQKEELDAQKDVQIVGGSIGLLDEKRTEMVINNFHWIFLELAHADLASAHSFLREIASEVSDWQVLVAGNVCTPQATERLFSAGADLVKCGQGGGSICSTRIVTGCGYPQFSAVQRCAEVGPIIADGGIKSSGDIVKSLAIGARLVMVGSLFAGTNEARGERVKGTGKKRYFGSASAENGYVEPGYAPEGVSTEVPYMGPATDVAEELHSGIRQGMGLVGAKNLKELRDVAEFVRVTHAGFIEGTPHIQNR